MLQSDPLTAPDTPPWAIILKGNNDAIHGKIFKDNVVDQNRQDDQEQTLVSPCLVAPALKRCFFQSFHFPSLQNRDCPQAIPSALIVRYTDPMPPDRSPASVRCRSAQAVIGRFPILYPGQPLPSGTESSSHPLMW